MISAGDLRERVAIQRRAAGQDAAGQPATTWEPAVPDTADNKVWASVRYPAGLASIRSGAESSTVKASVRIRRRAGIDAGMRVVAASGAVLEILAILPDAASGHLDLVCQEVK